MVFLSWPDSGRSSTHRFLENCAPRKTLQLSIKMRNIHASAAPKTTNYAISYVFCNLFRFPTFVSKLLCGKLANSLQFLIKCAQCAFFAINICILQPSPPTARQPGRPAASPPQPARQAAGQPARRSHKHPESLSEMQTEFSTGTCCVPTFPPPTSNSRGGMGEDQTR